MKIKTITPKFVTHLPEELAEGVLYISEEFSTAAHLCCCGCKEEVITPLNKASWKITKFSNTVSLHPSIGNWKFSCKSHYWIRNNQVIESQSMSQSRIEMVIQKDKLDKAKYIHQINKQIDNSNKNLLSNPKQSDEPGLLSFIVSLFKRK